MHHHSLLSFTTTHPPTNPPSPIHVLTDYQNHNHLFTDLLPFFLSKSESEKTLNGSLGSWEMISGMGKLFVGGLSWGTNEKRLREYFESYGEVAEAVIMKDRATGRARGFGFVEFVDHGVAERVVKERHCIDGRMVEAKKAVPRDDQSIASRCGCNIHVSPSQWAGIKKIFVGGLAATVTDSEFRRYFEQFGEIVDTVIMYDHTTRKPRGFGFISFDSEEAVGRVLLRPFHQLNGKKVEVKRAIPKEPSSGPIRTPLRCYNHNTGPINTSPSYGYSPLFGPGGAFSPGLSGFESGSNLEGCGLFSPYVTRTDSPFSSCTGFDNIWGSDGLSYGSLFGRSNPFKGSKNMGFGEAGKKSLEVENLFYNNENLTYINGDDIFNHGVAGVAARGRHTENVTPRTRSYVTYSGTLNSSVGGHSSYGDTSAYRNMLLHSKNSEWDEGGFMQFAFGLNEVICRDPDYNQSPGFIRDC